MFVENVGEFETFRLLLAILNNVGFEKMKMEAGGRAQEFPTENRVLAPMLIIVCVRWAEYFPLPRCSTIYLPCLGFI
jgi:hypothetical protein